MCSEAWGQCAVCRCDLTMESAHDDPHTQEILCELHARERDEARRAVTLLSQPVSRFRRSALLFRRI